MRSPSRIILKHTVTDLLQTASSFTIDLATTELFSKILIFFPHIMPKIYRTSRWSSAMSTMQWCIQVAILWLSYSLLMTNLLRLNEPFTIFLTRFHRLVGSLLLSLSFLRFLLSGSRRCFTTKISHQSFSCFMSLKMPKIWQINRRKAKKAIYQRERKSEIQFWKKLRTLVLSKLDSAQYCVQF